MKVIIALTILILAGCATSNPETTKITKTECVSQGGIIVETDSALDQCFGGGKPVLIVRTEK